MTPLLRPALLAAALCALTACGSTKATKRYSRDEAASSLKKLEAVSLELGEFPIDGADSVLDGDTIRVRGLPASLRLLGIDAEETFKHDSEREAFASGWEQYKKKVRGSSSRPVKFATPLGEDGKHFAQDFFREAKTVRLERDHPGEIRDFYNRYLAYVFVQRDGKWVNYNVECVRAGMSPYFVKYGRSRRFHEQFVTAQNEARAAKRGIWADGAQHYDDYDERLRWWGEREAVIWAFEQAAEESPESHVALTRWDALRRLESRLAKDAVVLGSVQDVKYNESGPAVVQLARTRINSFDVVFFDRDVLLSSGITAKKGEYVQVRGRVAKYRDRRGQERLQLVVSLPSQVQLGPVPLKLGEVAGPGSFGPGGLGTGIDVRRKPSAEGKPAPVAAPEVKEDGTMQFGPELDALLDVNPSGPKADTSKLSESDDDGE